MPSVSETRPPAGGRSPAPGAVPAGAIPAFKVEDLSVVYKTSVEKAPTLRSTIRRLGRRQRVTREIQALRGVSFAVEHGTTLGIVGANGAGKSTLVRTLAGIMPPTSGRVEVHGSVSTLLALGVGFNKELTGRDNVVLGGLAGGLSRKQIEERSDSIEQFAELGDFIDMPMRTYSAGMYSRLAFSVAVNMEPDIFLIDEALSAGDAHFKQKSFAKMKDLVNEERTIVLVSHALGSIKELCTDAIWINKGELIMRGHPDEVVDAYMRFLKVGETPSSLEDV